MALFNFGKKKEEQAESPVCCCGTEPKASESGRCSAPQAEKTASCCCGAPVDGICCVKVLGAGCKSCHEQYENAKTAVKAMGLSVEVEYITDMEKVMAYGVMSMPALVIEGKVVSAGKVLKAKEVEKFLH